jgi:hypothetical protein
MKAFATIEPGGLRTEEQLRKWVTMAAEFAAAEGPRVGLSKEATRRRRRQ